MLTTPLISHFNIILFFVLIYFDIMLKCLTYILNIYYEYVILFIEI